MPGRIVVRLAWLIAALSIHPDAFAQTPPELGVITGTIRDSSGGAIPGAATVRIVDERSGVSVEVVSSSDGTYRTSSLRPGSYRVETALDGFEAPAQRISRAIVL